MLENLGKPVIFTGAVVPFHEVYSDARRNLALSIHLAATVDMNEGALIYACTFYSMKGWI